MTEKSIEDLAGEIMNVSYPETPAEHDILVRLGKNLVIIVDYAHQDGYNYKPIGTLLNAYSTYSEQWVEEMKNRDWIEPVQCILLKGNNKFIFSSVDNGESILTIERHLADSNYYYSAIYHSSDQDNVSDCSFLSDIFD